MPAGLDSDPETTLLVVLGASEFPRINIKSSKAFEYAAKSVCSYFASGIGFRLPIENLFYFFNSPYGPDTLDDQITTRLRTRVQQLEAAGRPARDLILYYVGHGSFDEQKRYILTLQSTREESQSVSSLRVDVLMTTLNSVGHTLRKYVIIDACFAGEGVIYSQSGIEDAVHQQIRHLPQKGTAFLCSSSRDLVSEFLQDETNTVFTKALCECLWEGRSGLPSKLSFEHLHSLVEDKLIEKSNNFIRPEIHTPSRPEGDIAKVPFFPNGPKRTANQLAERERMDKEETLRAFLRNQLAEQTLHAQKISAEKQTRDNEIREQLLVEQKREHAQQTKERRHYDSEDEKKFREEAEVLQNRDLNRDLLVEWLGWKSSQSHIRVGALRQLATEHEENAATHQYHASNIWDAKKREEKSGSDQVATHLINHWRELISEEKIERKKAKALSYEAEDADIASQFYAAKANDATYINEKATCARMRGRSFHELVDPQLRSLIKYAQWRRRTMRALRACLTGARRIGIGIIIFFILFLMAQCDKFLRYE